MILTEHLLNAGRRPKTFKRARKSHNYVRQKKKREKGIRTGPEPLGGNIKHGKLSAHWEVHSPAWNTCTGWAGAGCWGSGFRGQTKERTGVGCVGTAWGGEGVVTTMWEGAWAITGEHKEGGTATGASFSARSQAAGHHLHTLQGRVWASAPISDSRGRHRLLLLLRVPGSGTNCCPRLPGACAGHTPAHLLSRG